MATLMLGDSLSVAGESCQPQLVQHHQCVSSTSGEGLFASVVQTGPLEALIIIVC